jgi:uncharacterized membrane protein YbhN (UPF0104 family)
MQRNNWATLFKALSSFIILYLLYRNLDLSSKSFIDTWNQIELGWLLIVLPIVVLVLGLKSFRWRSIVLSDGYSYPWKSSFVAYLAAYSIGVVTPGRVGEFLKVYSLRREVQDLGTLQAFQTVLVDRLFDMCFLGWFGFSGLLYFLKPFGKLSAGNALLVSLIFVVLGLFLANYILAWVTRNYFRENKLLLFSKDCLNRMPGTGNIHTWIYTALAYAIYFASIHFLMLSLNILIPFIETCFIISLIGLILLLPISVAGFGTREAGLVYLFSLYNLSAETAISFSLLQFASFFVWGGLIGLFFYNLNPISFNELKTDVMKILRK